MKHSADRRSNADTTKPVTQCSGSLALPSRGEPGLRVATRRVALTSSLKEVLTEWTAEGAK